MLDLEEARAFINSRNESPYQGEDQWAAVKDRDYVQLGNLAVPPGTSHVQTMGYYPPWGDNPESAMQESNYAVLYYDYNCFEMPDQDWRRRGGRGQGCCCNIF